jgi:hypothetical protein
MAPVGSSSAWHDATIIDVVSSIIAIIVVSATVYLAVMGEAQAQTALTGLAGASSSYFLTNKIKNTTSGGSTAAPSG